MTPKDSVPPGRDRLTMPPSSSTFRRSIMSIDNLIDLPASIDTEFHQPLLPSQSRSMAMHTLLNPVIEQNATSTAHLPPTQMSKTRQHEDDPLAFAHRRRKQDLGDHGTLALLASCFLLQKLYGEESEERSAVLLATVGAIMTSALERLKITVAAVFKALWLVNRVFPTECMELSGCKAVDVIIHMVRIFILCLRFVSDDKNWPVTELAAECHLNPSLFMKASFQLEHILNHNTAISPFGWIVWINEVLRWFLKSGCADYAPYVTTRTLRMVSELDDRAWGQCKKNASSLFQSRLPFAATPSPLRTLQQKRLLSLLMSGLPFSETNPRIFAEKSWFEDWTSPDVDLGIIDAVDVPQLEKPYRTGPSSSDLLFQNAGDEIRNGAMNQQLAQRKNRVSRVVFDRQARQRTHYHAWSVSQDEEEDEDEEDNFDMFRDRLGSFSPAVFPTSAGVGDNEELSTPDSRVILPLPRRVRQSTPVPASSDNHEDIDAEESEEDGESIDTPRARFQSLPPTIIHYHASAAGEDDEVGSGSRSTLPRRVRQGTPAPDSFFTRMDSEDEEDDDTMMVTVKNSCSTRMTWK
ncbi:hypothetical protein D9758_004401 [Tetrapyrgos nigripes]|uniref:Uncharacterized protein n=1 Tax=Tetrapyrgos nigripes TaxID=182062 RepID=A0A8H5GN63_9AGAR|nr:hypothetical protein D9758_004401 [Tetrapyrgos nigripes]